MNRKMYTEDELAEYMSIVISYLMDMGTLQLLMPGLYPLHGVLLLKI